MGHVYLCIQMASLFEQPTAFISGLTLISLTKVSTLKSRMWQLYFTLELEKKEEEFSFKIEVALIEVSAIGGYENGFFIFYFVRMD